MNRRAFVTSIESVRAFRRVLMQFEEHVRDALVSVEMESQRGIEWVRHDRPQYWRRQYRKAEEDLAKAKQALSRCKMQSFGDHVPSCYEEREAVEKAMRRAQLCKEKIERARAWSQVIDHEADEFTAKLGQMRTFMDVEFPRIQALLQRMATALEKYSSSSGGERVPGADEAAVMNSTLDAAASKQQETPSPAEQQEESADPPGSQE